MDALGRLAAGIFLGLRERKGALLVFCALALALGGISLSRTPMSEDISELIPEKLSEEFSLLKRAPLAKKLIINIHTEREGAEPLLKLTADRFVERLDPALFTTVMTGPDSAMGQRLAAFFLDTMPRLSTVEDMERIGQRLAPGEVERRIEEAYRLLISPAGWGMKGILRRDPLRLWEIALPKIKHVNLLGKMRLGDGYFLSSDGKSLLAIAKTPVVMTDSAGAEALIAEFEQVKAAILPEGVEADIIGAHRYTLANANSIKGDLKLILTVASLAILALFFFWLKGLAAVAVFAIPAAGVLLSAAITGALNGTISGITLGFGGVLLGISVDYGLHVYYACRTSREPAAALARVARPVAFAGLTTLGAFAVLFTSELPGQRQLALFSVIGVTICLVAALVILPQFINNVDAAEPGGPRPARTKAKNRKAILAFWALWMLFFAFQATNVSFEGNLKNVGYVPDDITRAEEKLAESWGNIRGKAILFSSGATADGAAAASEELFNRLNGKLGGGEIVSLSRLLPSLKTQEENLRHWSEFWTKERRIQTRERVRATADRLGFTTNAFEPFLLSLEQAPGPVTADMLDRAGLGELVEALLFEGGEDGKEHGSITLVPDTDPVRSVLAELGEVKFISPGDFALGLGESIRDDFLKFLSSALVVVILLTLVVMGTPRRLAAALVPVATGLITLFGVCGLLGWSFNIFNIVASILIVGLGIDYGIFMVCRTGGEEGKRTDRAVVISGLTTLAGMGSLVLATHPALSSIGLTVAVGVGASIPAALWVVPIVKGGER